MCKNSLAPSECNYLMLWEGTELQKNKNKHRTRKSYGLLNCILIQLIILETLP